jgi:CubicO group peptidase (beta-lactamase class C family)
MTAQNSTLLRTLISSGVLLAGAAATKGGPALARADAAPPSRYQAYFDAAIPAQLASEHLVGAAVAVVANGELAFARGYGHQDAARQVGVTADQTLFYIGSDGKLFTWTAVMQLVEQGRLDLHTDVNAYLDFELPEMDAEPITLHHLLTHTAGFEEDYRSLFVATRDQVRSLGDHVRTAVPARVYPPGSVMAYSNYGTALAGYIVERVSGEPFDAYVQAHLLAPLGMTHSWSGLDLPDPMQTALSAGFRHPFGREQAVAMEWTAASPAGPIRTTATDLSRFMLAHLNTGCLSDPCLLQPKTAALMQASHFTHPGQTDGMAYGWMRSTFNGQRVLWHLGESAHFVSLVALIPDRGVGLFFSFNTAPANWRATLQGFMDTFYPTDRPAPTTAPLPDWEHRASQFNGLYAPARDNWTSAQGLGSLTALTRVRIDQGRLVFNGWEFIEVSPGSFAQVNGDRRLTLSQAADGQRWVYVGVQAYRQVPWTNDLGIHVGLLAPSVLMPVLMLGLWVGQRRRPTSATRPGPWILTLTGGLVLYNAAIIAGLGWVLWQLAEAYIFDQTLMTGISHAAWLVVPGALALALVAVRAWLAPAWAWGWRLYAALAAGSTAVLAVWLWQTKVIGL